MPDWTKSMQQTFEYYLVNPETWKEVRQINNVKSSSLTQDLEVETLGSATFDIEEPLGECYIRVYLITIQNGVKEKHPLGTYLIQTPSSNFDGKSGIISMDAYTPLLELKENPPPIGYSVLKDTNIMTIAHKITKEQVRAPVVEAISSETLFSDFVANTDDTWLSFLNDLIANAKYTFTLDEMGRILFSPNQKLASLQPVWTYDSSNTSILYPDISMDYDLYGVPNVVEVIYSSDDKCYYSRVVNDDSDSPTSTVNRGREIIHRVTEPILYGNPTDAQVEEYATRLLQNLSSIEYTVSYSHGYCPVKVGDCVRLDYPKAGLNGVKARVISQTIKCEPGCPVDEKAVFTAKLWR